MVVWREGISYGQVNRREETLVNWYPSLEGYQLPEMADRNVIVLAMVYINMVLGPNDGVFKWVISPNGGGLNVTHD